MSASDSIQPTRVTFPNQFISMAANLFVPPNMERGKRYPALVVGHPFGGVKEQTAGIYASKMAKRGYVTLAYDASHQGESGGIDAPGQPFYDPAATAALFEAIRRHSSVEIKEVDAHINDPQFAARKGLARSKLDETQCIGRGNGLAFAAVSRFRSAIWDTIPVGSLLALRQTLSWCYMPSPHRLTSAPAIAGILAPRGK